MISSFSQYLVEEERVVYFTFGRMNPPTIGHGKLLDALSKKAGRNPYKVYLSQSNNPKKDPVPYANKIKHVRKMFPKHGRAVVVNKKVITPFHALSDLYNQGFRQVVMVAGSDRVQEYDLRLNKYNGKKGQHGFYNFKGGVKIVNAGARDPDAEGAEGASGTKQRKYAADNNFTGFSQGLPKNMSNADAKRLFNDVRKGMGLKEEKTFKNHIQLETVSDRREQYIAGNLFAVSDEVVIKETNDVGTIEVIGSNYVIVESNGQRKRHWLDSVEKIEEKKLTPNELKKREKVAKAIKRDNPNMPMDKKMAIATSVAKKHAENYLYDYGTDASVKVLKKQTPGQNEGLWDNIHAKRRRGEKMRKKGEKGAPTPDQIKRAQGENTSVRQDPDIASKKGTQPAKYYTGMSKSTKAKRDAHFKAKKSGPAPGDANRKTKPSTYTNFVKNMMKENYNQWIHSEPVEYAKHLEKTFGKPDEITDSQLCWFAKDGFKRIVIKDEYILHGSPAPHYDFIYCYIDLKVPEKYARALAESSGSIMIDYLKGEVGARCGSITANATTLNYVLDVVAERVVPSKKEYEKRILSMKAMFEKGEKYTTDWWPDQTGDADPKNKYYAEGNHMNVCGCSLNEKMNQAVAKAKIDREKKMDAIKHDRMMDRARSADTKRANAKENFRDGKNPERKGLAKRSGVNTKASISDLRKTAKNSSGEKRRMAHWLANMKSGKRKANESLEEASFEDKAKKSGISVGTLKKVYQRGVAAWKTGHRPGTTPSQWGHARVNAFITKKKRGGLNHDKDLA